jgi:hypothetical protein
VGGECQRQLGGVDACSVVGDSDERPPAVLGLDDDLRRAGIDGILDQLLDRKSVV